MIHVKELVRLDYTNLPDKEKCVINNRDGNIVIACERFGHPEWLSITSKSGKAALQECRTLIDKLEKLTSCIKQVQEEIEYELLEQSDPDEPYWNK